MNSPAENEEEGAEGGDLVGSFAERTVGRAGKNLGKMAGDRFGSTRYRKEEVPRPPSLSRPAFPGPRASFPCLRAD